MDQTEAILKRGMTAVDLFAGAGGATQGLKNAGFWVLAAVENDDSAAKTFSANHPETKLLQDDIKSVDAGGLRAELGLDVGELTLLKACPPCQGYSALGSGDPDDERNDLVLQAWRFVREFIPKAVTVENVPGLARDPRLALVVRRLRAIGYKVRSYLADAVDFGVPQRRRRLIVVAVRSRPELSLPESFAKLLPEGFGERTTAGKALAGAGPVDGADPVHRHRNHSPKVLARIRAVPVGGTRFDLPAEHRLACHERLGKHCACGSYGRIREDAPAPTLTTRCTTPACGSFIHPSEHRGLTLREAALLQTFPATYEFHGSYGQIEAQIGNAVPVRMAEGLGRVVAGLVTHEPL
ncbi:MAG TPA: DNA cytosine methyltransferase [Thermoanaerobaculia bacterium]|jgi:DNA (cytosine-5)-methyltransferase 1